MRSFSFFSAKSLIAILLSLNVLFVQYVESLDSTDTITWGGSNDRTGYQNNHNMDPAVVGSDQFGLLFKTLLPGTYPIGGQNVPEQIFSQPLVYTGSDGVQYVYVATTQNNVYKIVANTGVIVASRNLARPFLVSDLDGCVDINPTVGVTATGVIDPDTDTLYLTSKTYIDQSLTGPTGRPNGRYYIHAISTVDLSERPNFPVNLEGMVARNNPVRSFNGGIHHQRPGLLHTGNFVYAGFASHCVQYNFTGWIVGWDKTTGQLVEQFATEGAGVGPDTPGAGVWMSGGGIASDDQGSLFFASGNGYASQLNGIPVNGRNPPTALEEAAVHMAINDNGSLTVVDFFMPWEKVQLDGADKDLGTSPLELLPSQFSCGDVERIGVVTGKSGKTYWLNLDNLGGYQNGPNKLDDVLQVYQNENSVYAGAGVYPLEGGYIYINVIQYQTHVFKFSCNDGVPYFNKVADSPEKNAYILGVGHGTVTSLNDQPGTGLVWTSDVEGSNLRIYNAIPDENGLMTEINSFVTPGTTKFTRPVFGNGIVYQGTTVGYLYAYGAPVNLPLNCTALQFGTANLNTTTAPMTVQCTANTAVTVTAASLSGNPNFALGGLSSFPLTVAQGQQFSFQATFTPQTVGPLSSSVILNTTQQAAGFSINTPVQLKGTGQSQAALLMVTPNTVSWNGVITGQEVGGVNQSVVISNLGNSPLSINNINYSIVGETGPWISPNGTQAATVVSAFTFYDMPSSIPPNSAVTVPINFDPPYSGNYAVFVQFVSNGGTQVIDVLAAGSDEPRAVLEFQSLDGGWVPYDNTTAFSFGNVTENTSTYLKMRLTNNGSANAAALSVTVSKPPFGIAGSIIGANNQVDLAEGTLVYAGQNLTATLYCSVPKSQIDVDPYNGTAQWTMNLNDPNFGKQYIQFFCNAVSEQAPPLDPVTQQGIYRYGGCYMENNPGRQLQTNIYSGANNTNEQCISLCSAAGYIFAGTQYTQECWCGYNRPKTVVDDANCNFGCTGNVNEICGGNGIDGAESYISLFGDITRWNGNSTDAPGPYVNPGTLGYNSLGCYTEGSNSRALSVQPNSNNTVVSCLQACQGYLYAGVEYGGQCFCGNTLAAGSVNASASDCSMTCNNNQTEYCGGPNRLNMYIYGNGTLPSTSPSNGGGNNNPTTPSGPTIPPTVGNFTYQSCYTDIPGRALTAFALADNSITLQTCASNCTQYQYFGVEYGRECYCGNTLGSGSVPATDGRCNMACSGNSSFMCGGPNGLTLYQILNWTASAPAPPSTPTGPIIVPNVGNFQYVDCHTEITGRALTGKAVASSDMTVQNCAGNCTGFTYFAVEYSQECYCGNALGSGSVTATDGRCSMTCGGNSSTICGGPNGLSLYQWIVPSSSSSTSSTTSTTTLSTSTGASSTLVTSASASASSTSSVLFTTLFFSNTSVSSLSQSSTTNIFNTTLSTQIVSSSITPGVTSTTSTISSTAPSSTTLGSAIAATSASSAPSSSSSTSSTSIPNSSTYSAVPTTSTPSVAATSSSSSPSTTTTSGSNSGSFSFSASTAASISGTTAASTTTAAASAVTTSAGLAAPSSSASPSTTSVTSSRTSSSTSSSPGPSTSTSTSRSGLSSSSAGFTTSFLPVPSATSSATVLSSSTFAATSQTGVSTLTTISTRLTTFSTLSTLSTGTSSLTTTTSSIPPNPFFPAIYVGCAAELPNGRLLSVASTTSSTMTISSCISFCSAQNLPIAGVEYSRECYCGYNLSPSTAVNATGCSMACAGNAQQMCGGSSRLSIYNNTALSPPGAKASIGNYTYQGCFTDPSSLQRTLQGYSTTNATSMTQEFCISTCQSRGYKYAGVEYARECYCSNQLGLVSNGGGQGAQASEGDCSMLCVGNDDEFCGGSSRIGVWMSGS
ncbi:uncharacterized protein Z520_00251 [Fonsecaea multimorphosa CBS 102226]|uniref:WSC domain-containing protein n=1 Tax=Fonsecaea multimorphosa CBS 102226 TaxID=1442371 RepID=A0A0D2KJ90_9EURO|nr:uncharacterized protein Z520_00251 [Fonsecaea multimorphosa CBS 102226]KIY03560.1 hypothetical protein Z520_00251 [Fonsecaea multimorphosa CBS 102226]